MGNAVTVLKVKGLHTPRLFLWMKGLLDGKLLHTGGLDPTTGMLSSSYITGQIARFQTACAKRMAVADEKLKPFWAEADRLLIDYANLPMAAPAWDNNTKAGSESNTMARMREKNEKMKASREAERITIVKRLTDIGNMILAERVQVDEEIEATAKQLSSTFAAYGHGLIFKPVFDHMLPTIGMSDCESEKLCKPHDVTWNKMISIIKEEVQNDVV